MKKLLILVLALFATGALRAISRSECITRVESCEAILREFMADPASAIPSSVLQSARAIIIVNQFKGGFVIGVKDGYGVVLVKKASGQWSIPVLLDAGEASLGFQIGAKAIERVMIVTDDSTPRLLFKERFNVGVDAKAVAGPHDAAAERDNRQLVEAPVLVYTKSKGLFAGATLKAGYLTRDDNANFILYRTTYTMPELLYSDWVQPVDEVRPLMDYVAQIAR